MDKMKKSNTKLWDFVENSLLNECNSEFLASLPEYFTPLKSIRWMYLYFILLCDPYIKI